MDKEKLDFALAVGKRIASEYIQHGEYRPTECWGSEGEIYPPLTGIALLELYKATQEQVILDGVIAVIESLIAKQFPSGGWALELAARGNGIKFKVTDDLIELTAQMEDLPPTVTALRLIAEYTICTNDKTYLTNLKKGFNFLVPFWSSEDGEFKDMMDGKALQLRANPKSYHIFVYQALLALAKIFEEAEKYVLPLYQSVKQTFEEFDEYTYPLLYGMHAALIISIEGNSEYVKSIVKNRIENHISLNSKFKIEGVPGALGHFDGLRGFRMDEAHLRNSVGAALAMSFYDNYTNENVFTNTKIYFELSTWINTMYENGLYYEYVDLETGDKRGFGSSGQYLPIYWILGKF